MKKQKLCAGICSSGTNSMIFFLFSFFLLWGCSIEEENANNGSFSLRLSSDFTIESVTKASSSERSDGPSTADFQLAIYQGESESPYKKWDSFMDMASVVYLPQSSYRLKASYGEQHKGAFEKPYYEGQTNFNIVKGRTTEVSAICKIANTKVTFVYQDGFKKYFKDWSIKVASTGDSLVFAKDESRAAYFEPGRVGMRIMLTKQNGETLTYTPPSISTEGGKHYRVNLNVADGGAGSVNLVIVFDKTTEEKPITINLSGDKPLENALPFITPTGFTNGRPFSFVEGTDMGTIYTLVTARAKIRSCKISTDSKALMKLGWPIEGVVDLASVEPNQVKLQNQIQALGITFTTKMLGLQMAELDFSKLIPRLPSDAKVPLTHTIRIETTDESGYTNESFSLVMQSMMPGFELFKLDKIVNGAAQANLSFELTEGSMDKISVEYLKGGKWHPCTFAEPIIPTGVHQVYKCVITGFPRAEESLQIRLNYNDGARYSNEQTLETTPLNFSIQLPDHDEGYVYAKKAYIQVNIESDITIDRSLLDLLQFTANGKPLEIKVDDPKSRRILVKGLEPGARNEIVAMMGKEAAFGSLDFVTENVFEIPNAGFDKWYYNVTDKNGNPVSGNIFWKKYFPWIENDIESQGWNTLNQKTTQDGKKPIFWEPLTGCCYVATSGTIPTDASRSGKAALIRSVGWGNGNTATGSAAPKYTDAGYLYLGTYNSSTQAPEYGINCASRPSGFSFWYMYKPKNEDDKFIATIVLLNEAGDNIAEGKFTSGAMDAYAQKVVNLTFKSNYKTDKAAKMYIVFQSGTKIDKNKTDFDYPVLASDGEFVGSQLYVDDVELIYE